jgi:two-component system chemotaxis response regulator CheY
VQETGMVGTSDTKAAIRVLVVDDDLFARQALMQGLRRRGYQVKGAEDGLQALHHLQREPFNVVVTDLQMPRMDGVALLREIRRNGYAPVVVQTTLVDPDLRDMLRGAGASGVLVKGEPVAALARLLEGICRRHQE